MGENFWKDAYKDTWPESSKREKRLMAYLEKMIGIKCSESGLGAGSTAYISGSAERNGYQKGDADFFIEGTNVYIEVTGPLVKAVQSSESLWFRPDKLNNAIRNSNHDVFLAHHCMSVDLWRIIHVDQEFKQRFLEHQFKVTPKKIRGNWERYVEIEATDRCVRKLDYLVEYLRRIKEMQTNG